LKLHGVLKRGVKAINGVLYPIVKIISVSFLLGVVFVVSTEVFMRYFLRSGFPWTTELGTLALQYIAFSSMVLGVRYRAHISLVVVYDNLPKKIQRVLDYFMNLCILLFGVASCYYGYGLTTRFWRFALPATGWPQGMTYIICVFAGAIIAYEALTSLLNLNEGVEDIV